MQNASSKAGWHQLPNKNEFNHLDVLVSISIFSVPEYKWLLVDQCAVTHCSRVLLHANRFLKLYMKDMQIVRAWLVHGAWERLQEQEAMKRRLALRMPSEHVFGFVFCCCCCCCLFYFCFVFLLFFLQTFSLALWIFFCLFSFSFFFNDPDDFQSPPLYLPRLLCPQPCSALL